MAEITGCCSESDIDSIDEGTPVRYSCYTCHYDEVQYDDEAMMDRWRVLEQRVFWK